MKLDLSANRFRRQGFSLVELLVVIGVIGVIAALAIVSFSGFFLESDRTKNMRNAQSVVAVFTSARHAGAEFHSATLDGLLEELVQGTSPVEGPLAGKRFAVGALGPQERNDLKPYVRFVAPNEPGGDVMLVFNTDPQ